MCVVAFKCKTICHAARDKIFDKAKAFHQGHHVSLANFVSAFNVFVYQG